MFEKIKKAYKYITEDIWVKGEHEYTSGFMRWFSGQMKVFIFTISSYGKNQMRVRSAGLTYYTLMAVVPLLAVIFGIAKGFGFEERITAYLYHALPQYTTLIDWATQFAQNMIEQTKGGLLASIGFIVLLWSVIKVFKNTEESFNYIWEIRKQRSITRRVSDYIAILIIAPIVLVLFSMASDSVEATLDDLVRGTFLFPLLQILRAIIPFVSASLVFTLVYFVMPNTKVQFWPALKAGVIAGVVFVSVQLFYQYGQGAISRYNAIYGTFAALPLFLIWLNLSWQIVMFGAELSFGYQNIENYQFEREAENVSYDYRRKILLLVMHRISYNFMQGKQQMDSDELARELNLAVRIVRDSLFELEESGLIIAAEDEANKTVRYYPAHDVTHLRVYDVIRAVEGHGLSRLNMKEYAEYRSVSRVLLRLNQVIDDSDQNILLSEIPIDDKRG